MPPLPPLPIAPTPPAEQRAYGKTQYHLLPLNMKLLARASLIFCVRFSQCPSLSGKRALFLRQTAPFAFVAAIYNKIKVNL